MRTRALRSGLLFSATSLFIATSIGTSGCTSLRNKSDAELWAESDGHFNQGNYEEAKPYYDEMLRRDDANTKAQLMRGVARERTGEDGGALDDYANAGVKGEVRALFYRADLNIRRGEYSAAESDLAALRDMGLGGRDTVVHLTLLGTMRLKQKQYLFAAQNLERAVSGGGSFGDAVMVRHVRNAHYNAAQAYYQLGDFGRAYDHMLAYSGATQDAPTEGAHPLDGEESYLIGLLAYLAGDFETADHHLANADPDMVARAADVLDDPSFGAGSRQEGNPK